MIAIIDFGSQYTKLIARRIREFNVKSVIFPYDVKAKELSDFDGIILSGGPSSVYEKDAPFPEKEIIVSGKPILGICYGLQVITSFFGGEVKKGVKREYGEKRFTHKGDEIFYGIPENSIVWMSHGDEIKKIPEKFEVIGFTDSNPFAAIKFKNIYGLQFHPEVTHTEYGRNIIENFVFRVVKAKKDWKDEDRIQEAINELKKVKGKAILGISGGVDSTLCAVLSKKVLGDNFLPVLVDTGLLRKWEVDEVIRFLKEIGVKIKVVDAKEIFLKELKGVKDPEKKRKIIGEKFIRIFEKEAKDFKAEYLIQGTLYPDRIESAGASKSSSKIKTHHNVGGLPERLNLKVVEPLKEFFKDEVRRMSRELGIPESIYSRHPFPGPGLAVRIIGEVNERRLNILREADHIYISSLKEEGLYEKIWQAFAVLIPVRTVGVMGDLRTYDYVISLRAVISEDGMTADAYNFDMKFLKDVGRKIINNVKGVNRVVYDVSSKPPSTIEWE
uniref:GMP synthase [glutamine-hydrolyzing] n=1 Tax=candidate division WOR-3 bacterium TaxID=2052148 RepID=A0A7C4YG91_UNCW3